MQGPLWTVMFSGAAEREYHDLPADMRLLWQRWRLLIEEAGLEALPGRAVKHLEDELWEFRLSGRAGIARLIYAVRPGRRIVILRAFIKKTQRTPRSEIVLASARLNRLGW